MPLTMPSPIAVPMITSSKPLPPNVRPIQRKTAVSILVTRSVRVRPDRVRGAIDLPVADPADQVVDRSDLALDEEELLAVGPALIVDVRPHLGPGEGVLRESATRDQQAGYDGNGEA